MDDASRCVDIRRIIIAELDVIAWAMALISSFSRTNASLGFDVTMVSMSPSIWSRSLTKKRVPRVRGEIRPSRALRSAAFPT